jgi:hypothetical protein
VANYRRGVGLAKGSSPFLKKRTKKLFSFGLHECPGVINGIDVA